MQFCPCNKCVIYDTIMANNKYVFIGNIRGNMQVMKIGYLLILLAFMPIFAFAEGENTVTSKSYVDFEVAKKQNKIGGGTEGTVITNTGQDGQVGSKSVYKTGSGNTYNAQTTSLIEAGQANSAIQNGLNAHVTCYHTDTANNNDCDLWQINPLSSTYMPQ